MDTAASAWMAAVSTMARWVSSDLLKGQFCTSENQRIDFMIGLELFNDVQKPLFGIWINHIKFDF